MSNTRHEQVVRLVRAMDERTTLLRKRLPARNRTVA
jgi:hypothetical protein